MAASDNPSPTAAQRQSAFLSSPQLMQRLEEEINRATRHGSNLSCLLVKVGNLPEIAREHGAELTEQMLGYLAAALRPQLRAFDRLGRPSESELLLVLPGADGPRGEIVARRVLDRLHTIKIETDGSREPLRIGLALASWRPDQNAADLLASTRAAAHRGGPESSFEIATASPPALGRPGPS